MISKPKNSRFIILFILFCHSCATTKNPEIQNLLLHSNCNQQNVYSYTEGELPTPLHEIEINPTLNSKLDYNSLNVANAIGILDELTKYVEIKEKAISKDSTEKRLDLLELKLAIDHKINLTSLEISAISSEMDCEEERTSQIANYLKGKITEKESKLTISAIVVGAVGAILTSGLVKDDNTSTAIGITGGLAEATFGVLMFMNDKSIDFHHDRNALKDIWFGAKTSSNFPPSVWYYLNYSKPNDNTSISLRSQIISKWTSLGQISKKPKNNMLDIYFGNGGKYSSNQLENRADMYDQLESNINLMKQDLKALTIAIDKL